MSSDNDGIGVIFRATDENNFYRFHWSLDGGWDKDGTAPGLQRRVLDKVENGVWTVLASDDVTYNQWQWYNIRVEAYGDSIDIFIDMFYLFNIVYSIDIFIDMLDMFDLFNMLNTVYS